MKKILGVLIIILGIILGIYLGVYLMFYGGICQIIDSINPVNAKGIALGIVKIIFSEIGGFPIYLGTAIGMALINDY